MFPDHEKMRMMTAMSIIEIMESKKSKMRLESQYDQMEVPLISI